MIRSTSRFLIAAAALTLGLAGQVAAAPLAVGERAPEFALAASDGTTYRLSEVIATRPVVLAWYPRAFTTGCTLECRSLTQDGHLIRAFDVAYFMASVDPLATNEEFAREMSVDFPLLSDPTKAVANAYGVLHQDRFALRTTFYIDRSGTIVKVDRNVNPETAAIDMANTLRELGLAGPDAQDTGVPATVGDD